MDTKLLAEIIKMVEKSDISFFEVSEGNLKIKVGKGSGAQFSSPLYYHEDPASEIPVKVKQHESDENLETAQTPKPSDPNLYNVTSPMLGVFYSSPSPESESFVKVGDKVKKGDVLCIIEAMKLMNEIASEREGIIEEVCLSNGEIVEYGKTMFKIR